MYASCGVLIKVYFCPVVPHCDCHLRSLRTGVVAINFLICSLSCSPMSCQIHTEGPVGVICDSPWVVAVRAMFIGGLFKVFRDVCLKKLFHTLFSSFIYAYNDTLLVCSHCGRTRQVINS